MHAGANNLATAYSWTDSTEQVDSVWFYNSCTLHSTVDITVGFLLPGIIF